MKLDELARRAGTSARTVRYYVQRGLLPAPAFHGKDTAYGHEHLVRLQAIRRLQERYLPLDAIEATLAGKTLEEIERIAQGTDVGGASEGTPLSVSHTAPASSPVSRGGGAYRKPAFRAVEGRGWVRFVLEPGLELHVEEGADSATRARVEEILSRWNKDSSG